MSGGTGWRRVTLGAWLAFAFSALSVLLTILLAYVIERNASEQIGRGIGGNLAELANQTVTRLDRSLYERHREIRLLATRLGAGYDWPRVQAELNATQASYRFYAWIGVADPQGVVQAASGGRLVGQDVARQPWFQRARNGVQLGDVHPAAPLAQALGNGAEDMRVLDVAFPVESGGSTIGVLGAHIHWDWAKDVRAAVFRPIGRSLEVEPLIVDRHGQVLLGPEPLEGQQLRLGSLARAHGGETGFVTEAWPDGRDYLVGFARSRGFESSPGLGWTVLVRQELDEAYAPVREMQKGVLASGIAVAILFSVLGWGVASAITQPLRELEHAAREFHAGNTQLVQPASGYREVNTLALALNGLVAELQQNQAALRELNSQLEARVEQRTEELRAAFERVRSNEQRIQTIIESAQDPYIGVDLQGRIIDWNTQAEVVFGWPREEVLGRRLSDTVIRPDEAAGVEAALREFLQTGQSPLVNRPLERVLVDRRGRELPVEVKVGLVSTGEERFFSAFVHDISQRKEVERMKDEFVSTVSHELRTPLTAIYGSLDMLVSGFAGELPPDVRELLAISHQSTERLIRLINDMLDVEKIASGKLEYRMVRQPLAPLVEAALRDTRAFAGGLRVDLRLVRSDAVLVEADADRIVQVCVNLLSNAAKFSPEGGTVEAGVALAAGRARVWVADHGPGIPEAFRGRIFERFAQADASDRRARGGTGLGLAICRSIVEAHGGTIGFETRPHVRTEFWFELPAAAGAPEA